MIFCHVSLTFCPHLLIQEKKIDSFKNSEKLTNFCLVKIHSATYIILEVCFFPCIPMVISISSALINTISARKKNLLPI